MSKHGSLSTNSLGSNKGMSLSILHYSSTKSEKVGRNKLMFSLLAVSMRKYGETVDQETDRLLVCYLIVSCSSL